MKKKIILISSFDALASLSCSNLFSKSNDFSIIGAVKINTPFKKRLQISAKAIKSGSFFYLPYIFLEQTLPKFIFKIHHLRRPASMKVADLEKLCVENKVPIYSTSNLNSQETIRYVNRIRT